MNSRLSGISLSRGLVAALLLLAVFLSPYRAGAQAGWEVVASGLNNPRGLAFGPDGALYVAEAGAGGSDCFAPDPGDPAFVLCTGLSGGVTRIWNGAQTRLIGNMPSLADPSGFAATGPHDISFYGRAGYVVTGLGTDPAIRDYLAANQNPIFAQFGRLAILTLAPKWQLTHDVSAYEAQANPDGAQVDSNPYALLALGRKTVVVDAGGNDLVQVDKLTGAFSTLGVFPAILVDAPDFLGLPPGTQIPMDAVPTAVVTGPDGAYYVGQLTGFPFPVGGANVFRVPAGGGDAEVYAGGLTAIIDIAFGPDGSLYVLEIAKNGLLAAEMGGDFTGALIHIAPDGTRTEIASDGLVAPGGLALGADGSIYVSNFSIFPGGGEVVRITPGALAPAASAGARPDAPARPFLLDLSRLKDLLFDQKLFLPSLQQ
jgi:hypothetical protein